MKKAIALLIVTLLVCSGVISTYADFDFNSMSDSELKQLIISAQTELNKRNQSNGNSDNVLYDAKGIKWAISGAEVSSWSSYCSINTVVENNSQSDVNLQIETLTVNGWDVSTFVYVNVSAGKKAKEEISFNLEDADIKSLTEITTLEAVITVMDPNTYRTVDTVKVALVPDFS